jgi:methionyl-tRNA formyltransferase
MRIVFIGSGEFALPTLRWLAQSEHEVPLIITQPARPSGRGRKTTPTSVRTLADTLGLEVLETHEVNAPELISRLRSLDARLGLMIAFGQKLGDELLGTFPAGCINLHASLLPKYRGAAPINWAIARGEERTGCTVFRVVERMDAGPILVSRWTAIKPEETAGELHDRLAAIGVDAVGAALALYEGDALPEGTLQNEDEATTAPKLKKSDGFVRFDRPTQTVIRHIHAMTPWPGAACRFQSAEGRWEKVALTRVRKAEDPTSSTTTPGTIDKRRYVAALDGFVEILEIKPSSGRIMTWEDYVNGRHVAAGDSFVSPES